MQRACFQSNIFLLYKKLILWLFYKTFRLVSCKSLGEIDREQIEEWLFLKQECEECLSSADINFRSQKQLGPIQEAEEPDEAGSDPETSCQHNTDNESDSESQRPDLVEKIENLMEELRLKTDNIVRDKYQEFIKSQPKAVTESNDNFRNNNNEERRPSSTAGIHYKIYLQFLYV